MSALYKRPSLDHIVFIGPDEQEGERKMALKAAFNKGDMDTILSMQSQQAFDGRDVTNGLLSSMTHGHPHLHNLLWPLFLRISRGDLDMEAFCLAEISVERNDPTIFAGALSKASLDKDGHSHTHRLIETTAQWGRMDMFDVLMEQCEIPDSCLDRCLEVAAGEGRVEMVRHVMDHLLATREKEELVQSFDQAIDNAFGRFHLECVILLLDGSSMDADGALRRFGSQGYLPGVTHFLTDIEHPQTIVDAFLTTRYRAVAECLAPHLDVDLLNDALDNSAWRHTWTLYDFHQSIINMLRDQQQLTGAVGGNIGRDCIGKRKM